MRSQIRRGYNAFSAGWQKLAAFRRTQKWPHNFCQVRFSYIRDKFFHFARYCKLVNLIHRDRIAYVRLKIFVRIQTFRRRPFAASRNFCHPAGRHDERSLASCKRWRSHSWDRPVLPSYHHTCPPFFQHHFHHHHGRLTIIIIIIIIIDINAITFVKVNTVIKRSMCLENTFVSRIYISSSLVRNNAVSRAPHSLLTT